MEKMKKTDEQQLKDDFNMGRRASLCLFFAFGFFGKITKKHS
jgi:hypothetical protein